MANLPKAKPTLETQLITVKGRKKQKPKSVQEMPEEKSPGIERWLLTYSDLITLMMAFFTLLYATASIDAQRFKSLSQSLAVAFRQGGGDYSPLTSYSGKKDSPENGTGVNAGATARPWARLVERLNQYINEHGLAKLTHISFEQRGLVISLSDSALFQSGSAELSDQTRQILDGMGTILFASGKSIRVEGYTDDVPIHNSRYQSNWQLSTDRATSVIMYWIAKNPGLESRFTAIGYSQYHPVANNLSDAGRAQNRRVEIVILK